MTIRTATDSDIPSIVELLKLSLGESLMPKSETYWRWKHIENPFGRSPVLIAEADDKLVGVRAFMRWRWRNGDNIYSAVRAVDTATHPDYQGKGIFKKLTLQLVDECRNEDVNFVFNTPNLSSRPGYVKMGWVSIGELPVQILILNPLRSITNYFFNSNRKITFPDGENFSVEATTLQSLLFADGQHRKGLTTDYSEEYFSWRYQKCPVAQYQFFKLNADSPALFVTRTKTSRIGMELRLVDFFSSSFRIDATAKKAFLKYAKRLGADYVTCSGNSHERLPFAINLRSGPITTVRPMNGVTIAQFENFKSWHPTLGDLELF